MYGNLREKDKKVFFKAFKIHILRQFFQILLMQMAWILYEGHRSWSKYKEDAFCI